MLPTNTNHNNRLDELAVMLAALCQHQVAPHLLDQAKVREVWQALGSLDHQELKRLRAIIGSKAMATASGSEAASTLLVAHHVAAVFADTRDSRRRRASSPIWQLLTSGVPQF